MKTDRKINGRKALTTAEAAARCGCSVSWLNQLRRTPDRGPHFVKINGRCYYPVSELADWNRARLLAKTQAKKGKTNGHLVA